MNRYLHFRRIESLVMRDILMDLATREETPMCQLALGIQDEGGIESYCIVGEICNRLSDQGSIKKRWLTFDQMAAEKGQQHAWQMFNREPRPAKVALFDESAQAIPASVREQFDCEKGLYVSLRHIRKKLPDPLPQGYEVLGDLMSIWALNDLKVLTPKQIAKQAVDYGLHTPV